MEKSNVEIIATIRQEIERRITDNTFGAKLELIDILAYLESLSVDAPECADRCPMKQTAPCPDFVPKEVDLEKDVLLKYLLEHHRQELENILADIAEHTVGYETVTWNCGFGSITMTLGKAKETIANAPEGLDEVATTYAWEHQEAHTNEVGETEFDYGPRYSAFKAGAEWAFGQGEMIEGTLGYGPHLQRPIIHLEGVPSFYDGHCQEVIVQIRMK